MNTDDMNVKAARPALHEIAEGERDSLTRDLKERLASAEEQRDSLHKEREIATMEFQRRERALSATISMCAAALERDAGEGQEQPMRDYDEGPVEAKVRAY